MDIKQKIVDCFAQSIKDQFSLSAGNILTPPTSDMGDYCIACFAYSKQLQKSPQQVAQDLLQGFDFSSVVERSQVVGGYLNFFLNKEVVSKIFIDEILDKKDTFGKKDLGHGEVVCIDFSSVNLAKHMHIGHFCTTVIGNVIRNLFDFYGYKTIAINYVGDYGTPWGKMVRAYELWGNEDSLKIGGVDYVQDLYIRFCKEADQDGGKLDEEARQIFNKIENHEEKYYRIYQRLLNISIHGVEEIYDMLGITFDSWRGEAYYSGKMGPIVEELDKKHLLKESDGAKIVDLSDYNLGVSLILKKDGSTLYITRDLTACDDRFENYHFTKSLYVTDVAQRLHFSQFFKIMELLNRPYSSGLEHVYYGRVRLPEGKIASRLGKQALCKDILAYSINKTREIVSGNDALAEKEKECVVNAVGVGAAIFSVIKNERIKDMLFDLDKAIDFDGDTAPYIQYTRARCCSIESKVEPSKSKFIFDYNSINNDSCFELIKTLNRFEECTMSAFEKREPSIICRNLIDISKAFNKFYTNNRVIDEGKTNQTRLALVKATKDILSIGLNILGIKQPNKM